MIYIVTLQSRVSNSNQLEDCTPSFSGALQAIPLAASAVPGEETLSPVLGLPMMVASTLTRAGSLAKVQRGGEERGLPATASTPVRARVQAAPCSTSQKFCHHGQGLLSQAFSPALAAVAGLLLGMLLAAALPWIPDAAVLCTARARAKSARLIIRVEGPNLAHTPHV